MSTQQRRVVVTGLGVKSPAGLTAEQSFKTLLDGRSTAGQVAELQERGFRSPFACTVDDFAPEDYFSERELHGLDRTAQLGLAAAVDAFTDSGLVSDDEVASRRGVTVGVSGTGPVAFATEFMYRERTVDSFTAVLPMPNATAARASMRFGLRGPSLTYSTACASGSTAIGEGLRMIQSGRLDVVLAGGADSAVELMVMEGFARIGALSSRSDAPDEASRPFDADRDGFVMGEGGAFLVLEELEHALARGATIHAELAGYGSNCDAFHIVSPRRDGAYAATCMQAALADAGIEPFEVGHINAHGTSTPRNDETEALAVQTVFGDSPPPLTAPKGVVGHLFGAAGSFEAVATVLAVRDGVVPPVANHHRQDGKVSLDVVTGEARSVAAAPGISNSFGFGGHNSSLVFKPF